MPLEISKAKRFEFPAHLEVFLYERSENLGVNLK
jgi:hypothetical protein